MHSITEWKKHCKFIIAFAYNILWRARKGACGMDSCLCFIEIMKTQTRTKEGPVVERNKITKPQDDNVLLISDSNPRLILYSGKFWIN